MFPRRNPDEPMPPQSGDYRVARGLGYQPELGRRGAPANRALLAQVNREDMVQQRGENLGALAGLIGRFGAQAEPRPAPAGRRRPLRRPPPIPAEVLRRRGRPLGQYGVVTPQVPLTEEPVDREAPFRNYARRQHNPDVALPQQGVRRLADLRPARPREARQPRQPRQPRQRTLLGTVAPEPKPKKPRQPKKKKVAVPSNQPKITKFTEPKSKPQKSKPERTTPAPKEKVRQERTAPQVRKKAVKQTELTRPVSKAVKQTEATRPAPKARVREAEGTASALKSKKKSMKY